MAEPYVVFGGTFDPVHEGHLAIARAIRDRFGVTVRFLPSALPAHRDKPQASVLHRVAMLQLALGRERGFAIDTRELSRDGVSYTIDTVEDLRRELPAAAPIILLIGMDSLRQFTTWKRWRDIIANAHLIACTRPGQGMPTARDLGELAPHLTIDPREVIATPGGRILIETGTAVNMSSTSQREALAAGRPPEGIAPPVADYIRHHHLYTHAS